MRALEETGFTADECRTRILRGAVSGAIPGSRYVGRKLDAYGAFTCNPNVPVQAPVLAWTETVPAEIGYKDHVEIPLTVTDPLGLVTWVSLSPEIPGLSLVKVNNTEYRVVLDAPSLGDGSFSARLTAKNEDEAVSSLDFGFTVVPNRAPEVLRDRATSVFIGNPGEGKDVSVADWFSDPDGDAVSFSATVEDASIAGLTVGENGNLTLEGLRFGVTQLWVRASDGLRTGQVLVSVAVRNPAGSYVYPTSTSTAIHVAVNNLDPARTRVEIFSAAGASVGTWEGEASIFSPVVMMVDHLSPGIYSVRITGPDSVRTVSFAKV